MEIFVRDRQILKLSVLDSQQVDYSYEYLEVDWQRECFRHPNCVSQNCIEMSSTL